MKPDSRNDGIRVNCAICIACIWLADTVEKVRPSARLLAMNSPSASSSSGIEPRIGRWNTTAETPRISEHLDVADDDIGHDLGEHHLDRPHRHRQQILHRAALALAGDRQRRDEQRRHRQHDADQARHDVEHGQLLGIVAGVDHELERRARRLASAGSAAGRGRARSTMAASAAVALPMAEGSVASASTRIEGVSPRSTERSKFGGNVDDEQHVALRRARVRPRASEATSRMS